MALPTTSRATLRRAICSELGMEFFRRYGGTGYLTCDSGSTVSKVIDSDLTQPQDFWKNHWVYFPADGSTGTASALVGEVRQITSFVNSENACLVDRDYSVAPVSTLQYEIHDVWNATEIHNAINRAIRDAVPNFFKIVNDETLVLKEDTLEYDISGLTYRPWIISEVYIERPHSSMTGTVTSSDATSLTNTSEDFSDVTSNYVVSIYDGTGAGQLRNVSSGDADGKLNITAAWTTNPDTTSKYRTWDPTDQQDEWFRVTSLALDQSEYPDEIRFSNPYERLWGARIRLVYATDPLELSSDSDTTVVPQEFVIYKAIAYLAGSRTWGRTGDRDKYAVLEQTMNAKAEMFREKMAFRMDTTLWQESDVSNPGSRSLDNDPLGWRGR